MPNGRFEYKSTVWSHLHAYRLHRPGI